MNENGSRLAFPLHVEGWPPDLGLTKREWFAGLAMQAVVSTFEQGADAGMLAVPVAEDAVKIADALLAELAKEPAP